MAAESTLALTQLQLVRDAMLTTLIGALGVSRDTADRLYLEAGQLMRFDAAPMTKLHVAWMLGAYEIRTGVAKINGDLVREEYWLALKVKFQSEMRTCSTDEAVDAIVVPLIKKYE